MWESNRIQGYKRCIWQALKTRLDTREHYRDPRVSDMNDGVREEGEKQGKKIRSRRKRKDKEGK